MIVNKKALQMDSNNNKLFFVYSCIICSCTTFNNKAYCMCFHLFQGAKSCQQVPQMHHQF